MERSEWKIHSILPDAEEFTHVGKMRMETFGCLADKTISPQHIMICGDIILLPTTGHGWVAAILPEPPVFTALSVFSRRQIFREGDLKTALHGRIEMETSG